MTSDELMSHLYDMSIIQYVECYPNILHLFVDDMHPVGIHILSIQYVCLFDISGDQYPKLMGPLESSVVHS